MNEVFKTLIVLCVYLLPLILSDLTLWDVQVDKSNTPFYKENGSIKDEKGKIVKLYPDVLSVLNLLKIYGFPLSIASRITDISGAYQLINLFGLNGFFDHLEIYPTKKTFHFNRLREKTSIDYEDMRFFDDDLRNIRDVNKLGVTCNLVENGLNMKTFEPLFNEIFRKKSACKFDN